MSLMIWLLFIVIIASWVVLFKTPIGLRIRSVGEHPKAADTVGISVYGIRYACVVVSGMLAALGGAYLSIGFVGSFNENMSQALRKLAGTLNRTGTVALFTNQLREKIGVMFGNPETTTGGRALKFYSSVRIEIRDRKSVV